MRVAPLVVLVAGAIGLSHRPSPVGGSVEWLNGCWELRKGDRVVEEHWMPARGGVMLEAGRTTRADSLVEYEFVVLHLGQGKVAYEAHPSGQPAATFPLKQMSDSGIVFEDPAHDFPQRVGYDRLGTDSLVGWIEGSAGGRNRHIEFRYARVSCR